MATIGIVKDISDKEKMFAKKFPNIFKRYLLYTSYYNVTTGRILENNKDYETVIVKSLVAYFIYQEKKKDVKLKLKDIADLLNYRDHTGVSYAIKRIRLLFITQPNYKIQNKNIKEYFMIFNGIFCKNNNIEKN